MAHYVDGFLIPVPRKNLKHYAKLAREAGKVWRKHGALDYHECVGDDLPKGSASFPRRAGAKPAEAVVFSWITYRSRAHRNKVNAKVMKDPRMLRMMEEMKDRKSWPFEMRRMAYGGFKVLVKA
jgi:uncharacterized protein YbaA (DUF1428 family)